ncbi:MAG: hypothetical protein AAB834_04215 [Patescibacteria group bacterium]
MPLILETVDFIATGHDRTHHSRENGGHIVVRPKQHFEHRHELPLGLAAKLMHFTMVVGEAATNVLKEKGIAVVRINYQDNGNWTYKNPDERPEYHTNLYMRTYGEKHPDNDPRFQAFPEALTFPDRGTGYYDHFKPFTAKDCADIKNELLRLLGTEKYKAVTFAL